MPFNAAIRMAAAGPHVIPMGSPLRHVIVHYDPPVGGLGTARGVTLDCASEADLARVWNAGVDQWAKHMTLFNTEKDGVPTGFHMVMHADMTQVLMCNWQSTLTDHHQHWVDAGGQQLDPNRLGGLLAILVKARFLHKLTQPHLFNNVRT